MRVNVLVRIVGLSLVATAAGAQVMTKEAMQKAVANFRLNPTLTIGGHAANDVYVPVRVSWNAYPGTGARYTAAWSTSASGPWHAFPGDVISTTSVSVYVLPDEKYYVRVAVLYGTTRDSTGAATADATSERPTPVSQMSGQGPHYDIVVGGLKCSAAAGLVTLTWNSVPHAVGYRVVERGSTNTQLQTWDVPATSWSGRPVSPSDPTTTIRLGLSGVMYEMPGGGHIYTVGGLADSPFQTTIAKLNASQCP
jgi:hypothetical protein